MDLRLNKKKALISGGTHGIGLAIATKLAQEGCSVAVFSRTKDRVNSARKFFDKLGVGNICVTSDVLDKNSYKHIKSTIEDNWGGVDILINNVGGGGRWGNKDIIDTDESVWKDVYENNLMSTLRYTKMFLPYMLKKKWGRVVTITSIYGKQAGGKPWFNIAKTAQTVFMKNLAITKEYASKGITFNSVAPGPIYIPNTGWEEMKTNTPDEFEKFESSLPLGRLGTPEEVAHLVAFLCSEEASLINGASIPIDGGESKII